MHTPSLVSDEPLQRNGVTVKSPRTQAPGFFRVGPERGSCSRAGGSVVPHEDLLACLLYDECDRFTR